MDFLEHQKQAHARSRLLLWLFPVAALLVSFGVWFSLVGIAWLALEGVLTVFGDLSYTEGLGPDGWQGHLFDWRVAAVMIGATMLGIVISSLWMMHSLRGGGLTIALLMKGIPINPATTGHDRRQLLNIVEEMALASGMPVPPVFVIDSRSINAFAAGWSPESAVISVTQGLIDRLNRDEMQGVIAHEFSHIAHGDIRINARLVGVIHGIMAVGTFGRYISQPQEGRLDSDDLGHPIAIILAMITGVIIQLVGALGTVIGRVIQAAVSRQREFLADAAAVDYTRNPDGIAGALREIASRGGRNRLRNPNSSEFAHFFFSRPTSSLFATHPPLESRISRIAQVPVAELGLVATPGSAAASDAVQLGSAFAALQDLGDMQPSALEHARSLMDRLPIRLLDSIHDPVGAQAAILGFLIDDDPVLQFRQRSNITSQLGGPVVAELKALHPFLIAMDRVQQLVILDLAVPALSRLDRFHTDRLITVIESCIQADDRTDFFEWLVGRIILRRLNARLSLRVPRPGTRPLPAVIEEARAVVCMVARRGARTEDEASAAYAAGAAVIGAPSTPPDQATMTLSALDRALDALGEATPEAQLRLLRACLQTASHDGMIRTGEYQVVRAVADSLGLPMPPILPGALQSRPSA